MNLDTIKKQLEKLTFDELMKVNNMLEDAINDEHQLRCNEIRRG
jgi:hypothetical protein